MNVVTWGTVVRRTVPEPLPDGDRVTPRGPITAVPGPAARAQRGRPSR